jgi:hypothetical protein
MSLRLVVALRYVLMCKNNCAITRLGDGEGDSRVDVFGAIAIVDTSIAGVIIGSLRASKDGY